jgi:enoyl-[acyl-carrier protein] reductase I
VTGEVHFVDCGYNTIAVPNIDALKTMEHALALAGASPPKAAE